MTPIPPSPCIYNMQQFAVYVFRTLMNIHAKLMRLWWRDSSYWKLERVRRWTSRPSSAMVQLCASLPLENLVLRPSCQSDVGHDLGPQLLLHLYNSPASEVRRGSWVLSSLARCPWALWFHLAVRAQFEGPIPCIEAGCQPKWQNPASIFDRLEAANSCDTAPLLWRVFILTRYARGGGLVKLMLGWWMLKAICFIEKIKPILRQWQ